MPITTDAFKTAALACLAHNGLTADDAIKRLLKFKRGSWITFMDADGVSYNYHILGHSVNFELWAKREGEQIDYEIAFFSDH